MTTTDSKGREFDERPWGSFTVLDDELFDHKVKRLVVAPGKRLSYQRHSKRAEHWFVVSGVATVTLDGVEYEVPRGTGDRHRTRPGSSLRKPRHDARGVHRGTARHLLRRGRHRATRRRLRSRPLTPCASTNFSQNGGTRSFEFFPPKSDEESAVLARSLEVIDALDPSFVSVTYRGGTAVASAHVRPGDPDPKRGTGDRDGAPHLRGASPQ